MKIRWAMTWNGGSSRWTPETIEEYLDATYPASGLAPVRFRRGRQACFWRRIILALFLGCTCQDAFSAV